MTPTRLRECLDALRWSQRGLAEALGRSEGAVRQMARGARPIPDKLGTWLERVAAVHEANPPPELPDGRSRAAILIDAIINDPITPPKVVETLSGCLLREAAEGGGERPTADYIKSLAGKALNDPDRISRAEVRELAASVLRHIEPRARAS